jgi:hypothetical protein
LNAIGVIIIPSKISGDIKNGTAKRPLGFGLNYVNYFLQRSFTDAIKESKRQVLPKINKLLEVTRPFNATLGWP